MEETNINTNKSDSSSPSGSPLRTGRGPLQTVRSPSPFSRSPSPLSPGSSPSGSPSPLCPLNNESPKSPMVDLEVEEQEGSRGSPGTEEEREQEPTNEDSDTSKKRKTTSDVWAHFTRKKVEGKVKAQCHHCGKLYLGDSSQGTTHLRNHLARCPRMKFKDIRQQVLIKQQNKVDGTMSLSNYQFDQARVRNKLARMVILHEYPLSIVDHIGFREFVTDLQPMFKLVTRNTLKSDIFKIYDNEREKALKITDKNGSRMAITTDMWTSSNKKRGFMVITAHFIDHAWTLQSRVLRFVYVPSPHTKDVLADVLVDCFLEWNIDRKLSTITVDNCSTNDAMIRLLLNKLDTSSLMLGGSMLHMRCAAHILNLIVQDGLSLIGDGIERIRDSVIYWTGSPKRRQKFEENARQLRIQCTKELVLDCKTRWNSTCLMLSTALIYKDVFSRLAKRETSYTCLPYDHDWEVAKDICGRLELFSSVTEFFSGRKYPTTNMYFSMVCELKIALNEWSLSSSEMISTMAESMLAKFNSYWANVSVVMAISVILDPRYKMKLLEFYYPSIYGVNSDLEIEKIKNLCYDLLDEYGDVDESPVDNEGSSHMPASTSNQGAQIKFRLIGSMSRFDGFVNNSSSSSKKHGSGRMEFDHFIDEGVLKRSEDFDILAWWKNNGLKYPTLQRIAKDVLAIPVTTVASEAAFSTSGRLLSPHRSRLHPKTIEAMMCAQNWLWSEINGSSIIPGDGTFQSILNDGEPNEDDGSCATIDGSCITIDED
ncbi:zinc finger BED domain-containing protein RICESLEEPER 2-like [Quercus lobata]|uniref:BED-type domain-containing protein n=1 Tax=Quercus lobata TaxID=97700 RepID=A0A7N2N897_QUELO|nr:zinc finger BED domain-containing protein RICESLEEPER 2-like [Quercus lobata]